MSYSVILLAFIGQSNLDRGRERINTRLLSGSLPGTVPLTVQQQLVAAHCDSGSPDLSGCVSLCEPRESLCAALDPARMNARLALEGSRSFISKKAFSEDRRVVFLAGLEGSGHHLWRDVLEHCTHTADCVGFPELAASLWSQHDQTGLFNKYNPTGDYDDNALLGVRTALRDLRTSPSKHGLVWVNGAHARGLGKTGMMSYPNFGGPGKVYQHPDVWGLARVAEDEGEDLRILVLARQAKPLLLSTAVHRHFGAYVTQAVILAHNARVLASQLQALDPKFVRCVEYERLPQLPAGLGAWLDPADFAFEQAVGELFSANTTQRHRYDDEPPPEAPSPSHPLPSPELRDLATAHLDEALEALHRAAGCPGALQRAPADPA